MKRQLLLLSSLVLISVVLSGCATMMGAKAAPELRTYERIIDLPGHTKDQIYVKANGWFVATFKSAESVIEFHDKEAGKIMGKYIFSYGEGVYTYDVKQTVDVSIKDNRVRVIVDNPLIRTASGMGERYNHPYGVLETEKGIRKARLEWEKLTESLETYLNKNDEW